MVQQSYSPDTVVFKIMIDLTEEAREHFREFAYRVYNMYIYYSQPRNRISVECSFEHNIETVLLDWFYQTIMANEDSESVEKNELVQFKEEE